MTSAAPAYFPARWVMFQRNIPGNYFSTKPQPDESKFSDMADGGFMGNADSH